MPSPTCRTVPTSARSVSRSYCSIRSLRIDVISSGRSLNSAPYEVVAETLEPAADARVHPPRADLQHDASDQVRVNSRGRVDRAARRALDLRDDRAQRALRQLVEDLALRARVELRVAQHVAQLRHVVDGTHELAELVVHLAQAAALLR